LNRFVLVACSVLAGCQCAQLPILFLEDSGVDAGTDSGAGGGFIDSGTGGGGGGGGGTTGEEVFLNRIGAPNSGAIFFDDGGATCLSDTVNACTQSINGPSTFVFRPALSYWFKGWEGGCNGDGTDPCTLAGGEQASVVVDGPYNLAFVTPVRSVDAGPDVCMSAASSAGLPTSGWFPLRPQYTATIAAARGWLRVDGLPVLDRLELDGGGLLLHPITLAADGNRYVGPVFADPTLLSIPSDCISGMARAGFSTGGNFFWLADQPAPCEDAGSAIYCMQSTRLHALGKPLVPRGTHFAFLSSATSVGGGVAGFDAVCASDAIDAGLSASYFAFVATRDAGAIARLDGGGGIYYRTDGIRWTQGIKQLDNSELLSAMDVLANGQVLGQVPSLNGGVGGTVWSGSTSPDTPTAFNCIDWTDAGDQGGSVAGRARYSDPRFFNFGGIGCNVQLRLYCLQR
jgi:hypothetical protein